MKRIIKTFSIVLMLLVLVGCAEQKVHMNVTNSEVTVEVTDIVNSSIREESQVPELKTKYESLGYTVKEYDGTEDGMVGVICSKKFKLSDVASEDTVEFHLETIASEELKEPKFFKAEKGLFGTTYRATMVYDTKSATVDGFTTEELEENASSIEISYTVTLPSKAKSHNADSVQDNTYTWNVTYGETKEINLILTKTKTDGNAELINNMAEINEAYNIYGIADTNSTEGNKNKDENDLGSADFMISIQTGNVISYLAIVIAMLIPIGIAVYIMIKKMLLKEEI